MSATVALTGDYTVRWLIESRPPEHELVPANGPTVEPATSGFRRSRTGSWGGRRTQ